MHQHFRAKTIILKKENRGEADQVFTCFCEEFGKVEIIAKAIRKITSKLRSGIDIFYLSEIEFIQGKTQKTLTDTAIIDKFKNLRQNSRQTEFAFNIADIICSLAVLEQRDKHIWELLIFIFNKLNGQDSAITHLIFFWKLVAILGYSPELRNCSVCSKKLLPETFFFSPSCGGVICWQCFAEIKKRKEAEAQAKGEKLKKSPEFFGAMPIAVGSVKAVRFFISEPWDKADKLLIEARERKNIKEVADFYFAFLKENLS